MKFARHQQGKGFKIMKEPVSRFIIITIFLIASTQAFTQGLVENDSLDYFTIDSLVRSGFIFQNNRKKPDIILTREQAIRFLQENTLSNNWIDPNSEFRKALNQLVFEASYPRYDSLKHYLDRYPFDSLDIPWDKFYIWEPVHLKIPVISSVKNIAHRDSIGPDSLALRSRLGGMPAGELKDTTILVVVDTLNEANSSSAVFPYKYFTHPYQSDSLKMAVYTLLDYLDRRDSSIVYFTGSGNRITRLWLNSKNNMMVRFWLKNEFADSVTVWIGDLSRDTIGLYLEKGVSFRRPTRQFDYSDAYVNVKVPDKSKLLDIDNMKIKNQYWKYRTEASFLFSQASLSNWVKGGENSIATSMDITAYGDYNNKAKKLSSSNFIRLNLGFIKSGGDKIRKNLDLLETNSKLNHKAFGKFDFSAILLFKTQIAPGKKFLKDSANKDYDVTVSKFLNPAVLTIGLGLDYKPNKTTSINFSPLSYRATFVTDTTIIDQTLYGVPKNKKSKHEPGASFMISNEFKPLKTVSITNRFQLFTNYIHNPQNIDVDWEMIATANLNWFTDVRLNTHLIFDDDTKTPVMEDGVEKKTARIQFKELIGISLVFRF
jgi:hypothetical protein